MEERAKTIAVIPTYNEAGHLPELIRQILELYPWIDILVVDDNSPDGTGKIAEKLSQSFPRVKVLHRPGKSGLGKAYLEGFAYVLSSEAGYEKIIEMDADFSHDPGYIPALLEAADESGVAIGSRYIPGGRISDWRLSRRLLSHLANLYTRFWLGIKVRDCTSGFRCFKREVLERIGLERMRSNGYLFQIEVLERCRRLGYGFKEVPIVFVERKEGKTKLGFYEIWEALWGVLRLSLEDGR